MDASQHAPAPVESRLLAGGIGSGVSFAASIGIALVQVPVFLSVWSPVEYGLWIVVVATASLIVSLDLGHADYVGQKIILAGLANKAATRRLLGSAFRAALCVGLVELVVAACLTFTPLHQWGPLSAVADPSAQREVSIALMVLTTYHVVFGSIGGLLVRLYASHGMYARSVWIGTLQRCAQFVGVLSAVLCGGSLVTTVVIQVLIGGMFSGYIYVDVRQRFPALWPWLPHGSLTEGLSNLASSVFVTAASMLDQTGSSMMLVLSGRLPGGTATSVFGTTRTLGNTIMQASGVLLNPLIPEVGRYVSGREPRKLEATILMASLVSTAPVSLGAIIMAPLLVAGYSLWTRGAIPIDRPLLAMVIGAILVRQWCSPVLLCLTGLNAIRSIAVISAARFTAMVGGSIVALTVESGVHTLGFCMLVAEITASILAVLAATRALRDIGTFLPQHMLVMSGIQASIAGICVAACTMELAPGLLTVLVCLAISTALTVLQIRTVPSEVIQRIVRISKGRLLQRVAARVAALK